MQSLILLFEIEFNLIYIEYEFNNLFYGNYC